MKRTYRVTTEANDALAIEATIGGKIYLGPKEVDKDGYVILRLEDAVIERLQRIDPDLDVHNPIEMSELILDLVHKRNRG